MDPRTVYELWAPPEGTWSRWVKPVLFAHLPEADARVTEAPSNEADREPSRFFPPVEDRPAVEIPALPVPAGLPKPDGSALIVDLPALQAVGLGLELAGAGYQPVLLFNACPVPGGLDVVAPREIVAVTPLLWVLRQGAERLQAARLPGDAPAAFLLDADRLGAGKHIAPGWFDNRWVVFSTDFPSAEFLADQQINTVHLIHRGAFHEDLLDVLRDWQRHGIRLTHGDVEQSGPATTLVVPQSWRLSLARLARWFWAMLTLRRNRQGGYGGFVPEAGPSGA